MPAAGATSAPGAGAAISGNVDDLLGLESEISAIQVYFHRDVLIDVVLVLSSFVVITLSVPGKCEIWSLMRKNLKQRTRLLVQTIVYVES